MATEHVMEIGRGPTNAEGDVEMAKAYQCDRCSEFKKGEPKSTISIDRRPPVSGHWSRADICDQCTRDMDYAFQTVVRGVKAKAG